MVLTGCKDLKTERFRYWRAVSDWVPGVAAFISPSAGGYWWRSDSEARGNEFGESCLTLRRWRNSIFDCFTLQLRAWLFSSIDCCCKSTLAKSLLFWCALSTVRRYCAEKASSWLVVVHHLWISERARSSRAFLKLGFRLLRILEDSWCYSRACAGLLKWSWVFCMFFSC